jgi:hypothetical protein
MAGTKTRRGSAVLVDREHLTYVRVTLPPGGSASTVAQPVPPPALGSSKVVPVPAPSLLYRRPNLTSEIGMYLHRMERVPRVSVEQRERSLPRLDPIRLVPEFQPLGVLCGEKLTQRGRVPNETKAPSIVGLNSHDRKCAALGSPTPTRSGRGAVMKRPPLSNLAVGAI